MGFKQGGSTKNKFQTHHFCMTICDHTWNFNFNLVSSEWTPLQWGGGHLLSCPKGCTPFLFRGKLPASPVWGRYPWLGAISFPVQGTWLGYPWAGPETGLWTGPMTGLGVPPPTQKGHGTKGWEGTSDERLGYPSLVNRQTDACKNIIFPSYYVRGG